MQRAEGFVLERALVLYTVFRKVCTENDTSNEAGSMDGQAIQSTVIV